MSRILVVDDDDLVRDAIARMVASLGHEVVPAGSVIEAIAAAEAGSADLALLDMNMPGLDGLEGIKAIAHIEPRVPIIAMSGGSSSASPEDYRILTTTLGADQFLAKPFTRAQLGEAIARLL